MGNCKWKAARNESSTPVYNHVTDRDSLDATATVHHSVDRTRNIHNTDRSLFTKVSELCHVLEPGEVCSVNGGSPT